MTHQEEDAILAEVRELLHEPTQTHVSPAIASDELANREICRTCDQRRSLNCTISGTRCVHLARTHACPLGKFPAPQTIPQPTHQRPMEELKDLFEKVYVISLKNRPDRLKAVLDKIKAVGWPFKEPELWEGVPGASGKVPCPNSFTEGGGAFGCRQSHIGILQHCLMNDIQSVLILEDDADFHTTFLEDTARFLSLVPDDWQGIMLGGQHHASPTKIREGLVKVNYAQRTHCYAARGEYMRGLYARWACANVHIDWLMRDWQHQYKVYAPERWLVGQARSKSDINGRNNAATWWNPVDMRSLPVFLLDVPLEVMQRLRDEYGFHCGYSRNKQDLDLGLVGVFEAPVAERRAKLRDWVRTIQHECGQTDHLICGIWHPGVSLNLLQQATDSKVYHLTARTVEDALRQVPEEMKGMMRRGSRAADKIALVHASAAVVEELRKHGFHGGYWRGDDGIDNGLRSIYDEGTNKTGRLGEWIKELRAEAKNFGGVVMVWHHNATREDLEAAGASVVEIAATNLQTALDQWKAGNNQ